MKKLSDFYKSGLPRTKLTRCLRSLTFVEVDDGVYDILGDVDFSELRLNSLLEVTTLLKELTSSEIPIRIRRVQGSFNCSFNNLTDLKGAPEIVERDFVCYHNRLETLEGAPRYVGGSFRCWRNNLTDLRGAPERVEGDFECHYNFLETLEGAPKYVGRDFSCYGNPRKFTEEEVRKLINVGGKVYVV